MNLSTLELYGQSWDQVLAPKLFWMPTWRAFEYSENIRRGVNKYGNKKRSFRDALTDCVGFLAKDSTDLPYPSKQQWPSASQNLAGGVAVNGCCCLILFAQS